MAGWLVRSACGLAGAAKQFKPDDKKNLASQVVGSLRSNRVLQRGLTAIPRDPGNVEGRSAEAMRPTGAMPAAMTSGSSISEVSEILSIVSLVKAFRDRGHYVARLGNYNSTRTVFQLMRNIALLSVQQNFGNVHKIDNLRCFFHQRRTDATKGACLSVPPLHPALLHPSPLRPITPTKPWMHAVLLT